MRDYDSRIFKLSIAAIADNLFVVDVQLNVYVLCLSSTMKLHKKAHYLKIIKDLNNPVTLFRDETAGEESLVNSKPNVKRYIDLTLIIRAA